MLLTIKYRKTESDFSKDTKRILQQRDSKHGVRQKAIFWRYMCFLIQPPSSSALSLYCSKPTSGIHSSWEVSHLEGGRGEVTSLSIPCGHITDLIKLQPFKKMQWWCFVNITQHNNRGPVLLSINCLKFSLDFLKIFLCNGTEQLRSLKWINLSM